MKQKASNTSPCRAAEPRAARTPVRSTARRGSRRDGHWGRRATSPLCRAAKPRAARMPAGSIARSTSASCSHVLLPAPYPPWRTLSPARRRSRRDRHRGQRAHHICPEMRRKTPRCADAGGIDREADERVLVPASFPPWRARNPARRGSRRGRHLGRRAHHIPNVAPPNPALPAGLTAKPTHERDLLLASLPRLQGAPSPRPCQQTCRVAAAAWEEVRQSREGDFAACAWLSRQHEAAH